MKLHNGVNELPSNMSPLIMYLTKGQSFKKAEGQGQKLSPSQCFPEQRHAVSWLNVNKSNFYFVGLRHEGHISIDQALCSFSAIKSDIDVSFDFEGCCLLHLHLFSFFGAVFLTSVACKLMMATLPLHARHTCTPSPFAHFICEHIL